MNFRLKIALLLIGITFLSACAKNKAVERKHYYSWENDYGYSQVVRTGDTIYISGIASNKPTLPEQIKEIYTYIQRILNDYDVNSDAIVKQVIYTTDIEALKAETSLRKTFFNKNKYPSSSIIQIERLYEKEHLLEVEVVAFIN